MSRLRVIKLTKDELRIGALLYPERGYWRPTERAECANVGRPCPYVGCRYHLYLEVHPQSGAIKVNASTEPWEIKRSCALDCADEGPATLETIADAFGGVTPQCIQHILRRAVGKVRRALEDEG